MKRNRNMLSIRIKELRQKEGLTQKQLATAINISYSSIIDYENGRREPNSKAMAALESYFHVTGEYLRGEVENSDSPYIWQDAEVMDAVKESFPSLINKLLESTIHNTELEQKMLFDILVELCHMSSLKTLTPSLRDASFLLVEETLTRTTRFVDFCNRSMASEFEKERIEKYRKSCANEYEKSLIKFQKNLDNPT